MPYFIVAAAWRDHFGAPVRGKINAQAATEDGACKLARDYVEDHRKEEGVHGLSVEAWRMEGIPPEPVLRAKAAPRVYKVVPGASAMSYHIKIGGRTFATVWSACNPPSDEAARANAMRVADFLNSQNAGSV